MKTPLKIGSYNIEENGYTININIEKRLERKSRGECISFDRYREVNPYKVVTDYNVKVTKGGEVVYAPYIGINKERYLIEMAYVANMVSGNEIPKISDFEPFYRYINGKVAAHEGYTKEAKFKRYNEKGIAYEFCIDDYRIDIEGFVADMVSEGCVCKVADKKKAVRSSMCYKVNVLIPIEKVKGMI